MQDGSKIKQYLKWLPVHLALEAEVPGGKWMNKTLVSAPDRFKII